MDVFWLYDSEEFYWVMVLNLHIVGFRVWGTLEI